MSPVMSPTQSAHALTLRLYLALALLANIAALFVSAYAGDQSYWQSWTNQLLFNGYKHFDGNYPPVYIHWLYLAAKAVHFFELTVEINDLFKFIWVLPVIFFHSLVLWFLNRLMLQFNIGVLQRKFILGFTAINPAFLINGPVWGQVDLLGPTLAMGAICLSFSTRFAVLALPLYVLSLLTKFQMICFAPVFGFLFFYKIRANLIGTVLSAGVFLLVFLPFYFAGQAKAAFLNAYIHTLGQYPRITMNGANLWVILLENNASDALPYWTFLKPIVPEAWLKAKYVGMFLFASLSLWVFGYGFLKLLACRQDESPKRLLSVTLLLSMLCALGFFVLLPAMHERYLFAAVVAASFYSATQKRQRIFLQLITLACSLNMLMILGTTGSDLWLGVSFLSVLLLLLSFFEAVKPQYFLNKITWFIKGVFRMPFSFWAFKLTALCLLLAYLVNRQLPHGLHLQPNQVDATQLQVLSSIQDYGSLQIGRSVDAKPLTLNKRVYKHGFGTHAVSEIKLNLPENALAFSVIPGIDDEVSAGEVIFEVWEDDTLVWRSAPFYGYEASNAVSMRLKKGEVLTLKVLPLGGNSYDHADWVNPIITLEAAQNSDNN